MNNPKDNRIVVDKKGCVCGDERLAILRSEFAANVSHELRTPLTNIKGFADLLASGIVTSEEDRLRFLTMISVEADRMISLIEDILYLSELQEKIIAVPASRTEVLAVAVEAMESLQAAAGQARVSLHLSGNPCYVNIEPQRLRMLLVNLIENAIKYNRADGSVTVDMRESASTVTVAVSDTGIGIDPDDQTRVFERFYRVDKSRSKKTGGTGLGLAIVKNIVCLYGGRLSLSSTPGVGTTVTMEFDSALRG